MLNIQTARLTQAAGHSRHYSSLAMLRGSTQNLLLKVLSMLLPTSLANHKKWKILAVEALQRILRQSLYTIKITSYNIIGMLLIRAIGFMD